MIKFIVMNKRKLLFSLLPAVVMTFCFSVAHAQFKDLVQKAKNKVAQKANDAMDMKTSTSPNEPVKKSERLTINTGFDFVPGDTVLFSDNFSNVVVGANTDKFKTNGSASIVSLNDEPGKWLTLADNATYKFTKQIFYPKNFTLEFDILATADQIKDINPIYFGFINDNSVKEYNSGTGAYVSLLYYNDNDVSVISTFINKYLSTKFDLTAYANRKMHVSILVDGNRMVTYLDQTKIADTQMFLPATAKNFYISGPNQYHNSAKVLVSNFKVMGFKKG